MRINGQWLLGDDGFVRPVVQGQIIAPDGSATPTIFLVDTGADRTVFSADVLQAATLEPTDATDQLLGVGGIAPSIVVAAQVCLVQEGGGTVAFRGQFAAFTQAEALDMCVLGRDILNLFAVIVDRPRDLICLLAQQHTYQIQVS